MDEFPLVVNGGCLWPARIGERCRDVTSDMDPTVYPRHGLAANEIIVLLECDPLELVDGADAARGWTCVLDRKHVTHDAGSGVPR